jgi:hypothetical protein
VLVALPLDRAQVGGLEGELILGGGQRQIAPGELIFTHVVIGIPRIPRGAGRVGGESDLLGCRRHIVEKIEQHDVRFLRITGRDERFGIAHRDGNIARE